MTNRFVEMDVAGSTGHAIGRRGKPRGRAATIAVALLAAALCVLTLPALAHAEGEEAPTVLNQGATGVSKTSAILNALVNPNGAPIEECEFEYGTSPTTLTETAPCSELPETGENFVEVSAPVAGLAESTKYYFRIVAVSVFGEAVATPAKAFTTLPFKPGVSTGDATEVNRDSATLHGLVNPNDSNVTRCEFVVSTTPNFESETHASCAVLPGAGEKQVQVHAQANGLALHTVYYYRVIAENSFGEEVGAVLHFNTPPNKPGATTQGPSSISRHSVVLNGAVNPHGSEVTSCEFEYGPSLAYGSKVPCESLPGGSGESNIGVSAELSGLAESATYYYRVVATNEFGTKFGNRAKFTTYPSVPKVLTQGASHLTAESAQLNANVNPDASNVTACEFEWGTTVAYGHHVPCSTLPGAGESPVAVSATLSGLQGSTTYDFRIVAKNGIGTSFGGNLKFTTGVAGQKPVIQKLSPNKGTTAGGTIVKIKGLGFTGATSVMFGSTPAESFTIKNEKQIEAVAPAGTAGAVEVTVTTPVGTSEAVPADVFTFKEPRPKK